MSKHTYAGNELSAGDIAVDNQGTVWFYDEQREQFRYLTEDDGQPALSWDGFDFPGEVYAPFVMLDAVAAKVIGFEIQGLLADEQAATIGLGVVIK